MKSSPIVSFQGNSRGPAGLFASCLLLGSMAFSGAAFAGAASSDLIVRYRHPQNSPLQATASTLNLAGSPGASQGARMPDGFSGLQIVNGPEGVVKLSFKSPEDAARVRARLEASGEVENISPDMLYHLALHLESRPVAQASAEGRSFTGFQPLMNLSAPSSLPAVELPSGQVTVGADPLVSQDWAVNAIDMPQDPPAPTFRSPVITAVIDTGVDYNHEDLIGAMWRSPSNPRVVGYDFAHNNDQPYDVVHFDVQGCLNNIGCSLGFNQGAFLTNPGHGTHCAGHVGAVADNSLGIRGIGAGTPVMALKFFFDQGDPNAGSGDDAAAIRSIDYAIQNGVKVISASWGGRMTPGEAEKSELKQALTRARNAGVLFVVAAGNDGINQDTDSKPDYPAAYSTELDNLIVVAATDSSDNVASFSNYGAKGVDIGAPGVKIFSTIVGSKYSDVITTYTDSNGKQKVMYWDGTSMATPIVAGAVAAVWTKYPNEDYHQIKARILKAARQVPGLAGKVASGGVLDVSAALK